MELPQLLQEVKELGVPCSPGPVLAALVDHIGNGSCVSSLPTPQYFIDFAFRQHSGDASSLTLAGKAWVRQGGQVPPTVPQGLGM